MSSIKDVFNRFKLELTNFQRSPLLYFDRSFSSGTSRQIGWLLATFLIVLVGLFSIYCLIPGGDGLDGKFSELLIQLIDPGDSDNMPVTFTVIVDILGLVIFGGMLISVASNILERRVEQYQNGEITYKFKDHIVIIGYNNSVPSLVRTLRTTKNGKNDEDTYILIQSGQETEDIRSRLHVGSDDWMERNTIVVHGQCDSAEDLKKLHLNQCRKVYIIGDDTLEAHDSMNFECLEEIAKLCDQSKGKDCKGTTGNHLECHVMFEYQTIYSVFQSSELPKEVKEHIDFHPFNLHENWAKKVLVSGAEKGDYLPIEGEEGLKKDSTEHVHLIIVGMSRMGTAMAFETAQIAHYPNFKEEDNTTRTHITFIDCNAKEEMESFQSRFENVFDMMRWRYADTDDSDFQYTLADKSWHNPIEEENSKYRHLGPNFTDLQWEFLNGRVESVAVRQYLKDAVADESAITTICICFPDSQAAIQATLYLPDEVLRKASQVLVYQEESDSLARCVNNTKDKFTRYDKVKPFGLINDSYSNDKIGEEEGMWINSSYYEELENRENSKSLWRDASVSDKWSSIHCANMIYTKLRSIGCTSKNDIGEIEKAIEENIHDLAFTEHNRWVAAQLLAGWRPMFADEWENYKAQVKKEPRDKDFSNKDKFLKAHGNICSNNILDDVQRDSREYDERVIKALPQIIKKANT